MIYSGGVKARTHFIYNELITLIHAMYRAILELIERLSEIGCTKVY